jgi:hypothetical protein
LIVLVLRHLTRLILLLTPGFLASGEAAALPNLRAPQIDRAGQKLASGIFSETLAISRQLSASQAAESQQEKTSRSYDFASGSSQAAESAAVRISVPSNLPKTIFGPKQAIHTLGATALPRRSLLSSGVDAQVLLDGSSRRGQSENC